MTTGISCTFTPLRELLRLNITENGEMNQTPWMRNPERKSSEFMNAVW